MDRLPSRRRFVQNSALACASLAVKSGRAQTAAPTPAEAMVTTPSGRLRGVEGNGVRVFRGVPFAEPPVGPLRFRPPVPVKPWTGVRDATRFAAAAPQENQEVAQSEDCLYLNLWAPPKGGAPAPVFVWIHGGGFTGGEAFDPLFDGTEFARQGIVVVTVAYRLGVLGFLDLGPLLGEGYAGSANNAIRDLMTALGWVQRNIAAFGGDARQVTVGGESAGAKLTDMLTGVPAAKGLFHGMISESGGAERIWPKSNAQAVAEGYGKLFRERTGLAPGTLGSAPAAQLIEVQTEFMKSWPQHFPLRCELDGELFPELPVKTIAAGGAHGRRLLIGSNRDESALFLGVPPRHAPTAADLGNMSLPAFDAVYARYASVYPELSPAQREIRAVTAEEYWIPTVRVAEAAVRAGAEVYAYELDWSLKAGHYADYAFHSEELRLVWDRPGTHPEAGEVAFAQQVHDAWTAFLLGKAPAAAGLPAWPRYQLPVRATMMLDLVSRVQDDPQGAERQLWATSL